jgi:hypothetical protein
VKAHRKSPPPAQKQPQDERPWLEVVAEYVSGISHGTVDIVVHDSRVVQVEQTEIVRFESPPSSES